MVGGVGGVSALTAIVKVGSDAVATPSVTLMTIPVLAPTSPAPGVPVSWPVVELKVAQAGLLVMENVSPVAEASETLG